MYIQGDFGALTSTGTFVMDLVGSTSFSPRDNHRRVFIKNCYSSTLDALMPSHICEQHIADTKMVTVADGHSHFAILDCATAHSYYPRNEYPRK